MCIHSTYCEGVICKDQSLGVRIYFYIKINVTELKQIRILKSKLFTVYIAYS